MTILSLSDKEIRTLLSIKEIDFPKYTSQLINIANRNAQGTRPKVVGQMTELIKEFNGRSFEEWKIWYLKKNPDALDIATAKIKDMLDKLKIAIEEIDDKLINQWVQDLVLIKTYTGLKFHNAILRIVAGHFNKPYRISTSSEEHKGIDGYIADKPVSIKPGTYSPMKNLTESLPERIIYYTKTRNGIQIQFDFVI